MHTHLHILHAFQGVTGVMFGFDFVTVRKDDESDWNEIESNVISTLQKFAGNEHVNKGQMVNVFRRE